MPRAIAYLRVSTDQQTESGAGIEAQRAACILAAERLDVPVVSYHVDAGLSGSIPLDRRPGLLAAIDNIAKDDVLLVAKRDRLGRDVVLVALIERLVERKGARIVSAAGEGTETDGPSGQLMKTICDAFAQYERALVRARTKAALAAKKARRERTGGVPYGYADQEGKLIPIPEEQRVLRVMRELRSDGRSFRAIANELNERGVRPKRGKKWWPASVRSVLHTSESLAA
ncbi:recombinase family protein [Planctomycetota bacterium]